MARIDPMEWLMSEDMNYILVATAIANRYAELRAEENPES